MNKYKTLLFDLDNTLIDFTASEEKALNEIYAGFFKALISVDNFLGCFEKINSRLWQQVETGEIGAGDAGSMRFAKVIEEIGCDLDYNKVTNSYERALAEYTEWFPGVVSKLDHLKQSYQLGIITNGLTMVQKLKYQRLNMQKWFSCYVISEELGHAKPNPIIFDKALEQLNAERSTTLMFGDSLTSDYQGSINSKVDFCWINRQKKPLPDGFSKPKFIMQNITEFDVADVVV